MSGSVRAFARAILPQPLRRLLRRVATETPIRITDAVPDLLDATVRKPRALPPPRLRARVGKTSGRAEFTIVGSIAVADIQRACAGIEDVRIARVLDFGCGPGRVARIVAPLVESFTGVDVDEEAIAWCREHLPGTYLAISGEPPLPVPDHSFDFVYAISVFTHLDEDKQDRWLAELARVLDKDGILVVTTHSPNVVFDRPDLTHDARVRLANNGFTFAAGSDFSGDSAFHHEAYLRFHWNRWFTLLRFEQYGLAHFQDLSVFRNATTRS